MPGAWRGDKCRFGRLEWLVESSPIDVLHFHLALFVAAGQKSHQDRPSDQKSSGEFQQDLDVDWYGLCSKG